MFKHLLLVLLLLLSASAWARPHRSQRLHVRPSLVLKAPPPSNRNLGAKFDAATVATLTPRPLVYVGKTFIAFHSGRVHNDLMLFAPTLVGIAPVGRQRDAEAFRATGKRRWFPAAAADELELRREQDRLLLFRGPQPRAGAIGVGLAMFGATTVLAAHLPRPFRVIFDGPVHLGPAIFPGGGMGAGIAARGF